MLAVSALVLTVVTTRMPVSAPKTDTHDKIKAMNVFMAWRRGLTKKAEPPPTRDVNRDSGTASANGGWLRRLVRLLVNSHTA
jgi:hypothetical protein